MMWLTPVFAAFSLWGLKKIWPTLSHRSRIVHSALVLMTASLLIVGLFLLLVLTTGNFT